MKPHKLLLLIIAVIISVCAIFGNEKPYRIEGNNLEGVTVLGYDHFNGWYTADLESFIIENQDKLREVLKRIEEEKCLIK